MKFIFLKCLKNERSQTCHQTYENMIGQIWPNFCVVWTLFPDVGIKKSIYGVKKAKICDWKKIAKKTVERKTKFEVFKNLNGHFKTALNVEWRFQDLQVPSLVGPPQL